jgi:hypothetical protein
MVQAWLQNSGWQHNESNILEKKLNKTKLSEHPSIFNKSILFNSRIKIVLKNKLNNE